MSSPPRRPGDARDYFCTLVVLVCAGSALLVSGCFTRSAPMAALGVACIFGAVIHPAYVR